MRYIVQVDNGMFVAQALIGLELSTDIHNSVLFKEKESAQIIAKFATRGFTGVTSAKVLKIRFVVDDIDSESEVKHDKEV